ncbi:hypothetical protein V2H45_20655 [Tumidithrix elongata RA019]|uniref:Uncharacterized protein n=1 Tax=Tumidithrix elongata BACA0141 TaxID=2716417 RepID=A0AAW9Q7G3_9CYAN|nr:hypothetical protein [Tumidithrix elongata RA019]
MSMYLFSHLILHLISQWRHSDRPLSLPVANLCKRSRSSNVILALSITINPA